jgi:heme-degrading monooxygenase HmoA
MFISFTSTSSRMTMEQSARLTKFLEAFLPRMRKFPGIQAIYHYDQPEKGTASTLVIWESQEAMQNYRQSELIKEALAFEKEYGLPGTREAYPLIFSL